MNRATQCHRLPDSHIYIDFFRAEPQSARHYVLSHFHSDHYSGIKEWWNQPIHCTPITADLVKHIIGVAAEFLIPHKLGEPFQLGESTLTFIDANHCPGAAMIVCENKDETHLHCGDCRFSYAMVENLKKYKLHTIFLDTTYGNIKHCSEPQQAAIDFVAKKVKEALEKGVDDLAVFIGSYSLGKERILLRLIEDLSVNIFTLPHRLRIVEQLRFPPTVMKYFVKDRHNALIHVMNMKFMGNLWPYFTPNYERVQKYMKEIGKTRAICFLPTGWANASKWNREHSFSERDNISIHLVSYSEHSNMIELEEFMKALRPAKIIPTVYKDEGDFLKLKKHFNKYCRQESAMFDLWKRAKKNKPVPVPMKRIGSVAPEKAVKEDNNSTVPELDVKKNTTKASTENPITSFEENKKKLLEMGFDSVLIETVLKKESDFSKAVDLCIRRNKRKAGLTKERPRKKPKFGNKKQKSITCFFGKKKVSS